MDPNIANLTVPELLVSAEQLLDKFQFEQAEQYTLKATEIDPCNSHVLQFHAAVLIELGRALEALTFLQSAANFEPQSGHEKFFCLGQLSQSTKSLQYYQKGMEIIMNQLLNTDKEEDRFELENQLSIGYCAIAELYMTDLCEEECAERECERLLTEAMKLTPENPEVYRVLCDLYLVQQQSSEAKQAMEKCFSLWQDTVFSTSEDMAIPSHEFRMNCAKLMIEVQMFAEAEAVLEQLLMEDDEAALSWYLLGVSLVTGHANNIDEDIKRTAVEAFKCAERLILKECEADHDLELLESIHGFVEELGGEEMEQ